MKIVLAPTYELAKQFAEENNVAATVEAEYGDKVIDGERITLAHHGPRANNPAPCNDAKAVPIGSDSIVLISHLDLDTLGGILALHKEKPDDPEFWKAAEYIDVNGPHHIHELPQEIQDKLNAYYAFENEQRQVDGRPDREHVQDVTEAVNRYAEGIDTILDDRDYSREIEKLAALRDSVDDVGLSGEYAASVQWMMEQKMERKNRHNAMIEAGRKWERETTQAVEDRLVKEDENVRAFSTNGPFCNGSYYSPQQERIIPAVVSFNEKFNSITLSFADGGKDFSAREIVQELWGPEAGGRDGIAGSPRGQEMTRDDLETIYHKVSGLFREKDHAMEKEPERITVDRNDIAENTDIPAVMSLLGVPHFSKEGITLVPDPWNGRKEIGAAYFDKNGKFTDCADHSNDGKDIVDYVMQANGCDLKTAYETVKAASEELSVMRMAGVIFGENTPGGTQEEDEIQVYTSEKEEDRTDNRYAAVDQAARYCRENGFGLNNPNDLDDLAEEALEADGGNEDVDLGDD